MLYLPPHSHRGANAFQVRLADPAVATAAWTVRTRLEVAESYALRRRHVEFVRNQFRSERSLEPDTPFDRYFFDDSGWDRDRLLALYWLEPGPRLDGHNDLSLEVPKIRAALQRRGNAWANSD
jgi:hypothetical protein